MLFSFKSQADEFKIPHKFERSTPALASDVNDNFNALKEAVDRINRKLSKLENTLDIINEKYSKIESRGEEEVHIHTIACFKRFVRKLKLIIPEFPKVPMIVLYKISSYTYPISEDTFENGYKLFFENMFKDFAHNEETKDIDNCIFIKCKDKIEDVNNYNSEIWFKLYYFVSKDSVQKAVKELNNIYESNSEVGKSPRFVNDLIPYGEGRYFVSKNDSEGGIEIHETFYSESKFQSQEINKYEEAYNKIINIGDDLHIICMDEDTNYTAFYALKIENSTTSICRKCHSLDNYCNDFAK